MLDIMQSDLPIEIKNFWHDIGIKLQDLVNGTIQVLFDTISPEIVIRVYIKELNFNVHFSFPYLMRDEKILNYILNAIQSELYFKVFKKGEIK